MRQASNSFTVIVLLLATSNMAAGAPPDQDHVWHQWLEDPGAHSYGHWYAFTIGPLAWPAAEAEALSVGGHLVTVNDSDENQWLVDTFIGTDHGPWWIGFTDQDQEGYWTWVAGDGGYWQLGGGGTSFVNWWSGEPNDLGGVEDHAAMMYDGSALPGEWVDLPGGEEWLGITEVVPEPATLSLLTLGGLLVHRRRR